MLKSNATAESLSEEIRSTKGIGESKAPTSADLPLSEDSKRVLENAAEESAKLHHQVIHTSHLILGLLGIENCFAAALLNRHGITYQRLRELVQSAPPPTGVPEQRSHLVSFEPRSPQPYPTERAAGWELEELPPPAAPSLAGSITNLKKKIVLASRFLNNYSDAYGEQRLKRKPWSRKEAMGHLVNLAVVHHVWVARALTEPKVTASGYPDENWISAQHYAKYSWGELVDLWISMNRLLVHVLLVIPEQKVNTPCRIGIEEPQTLLSLIQRYVNESEDLLEQILARL